MRAELDDVTAYLPTAGIARTLGAMGTAWEEAPPSRGDEASNRQSIHSGGHVAETMTRSVEDLIGPLNELEQKNAPQKLWVGGDQSIFAAGRITSVVGSRHPSPAGVRRTRRLVCELVNRDIAVLSGLALGIDTVAHTTAIERGGRTIAVLGTPLDEATPRSNARLQDRITREHVAVSQFAPGSVVQKWNFTVRNRTMALLSPATVIVEAREGSGTQHQGWEALRLGRPLVLSRVGSWIWEYSMDQRADRIWSGGPNR